MGHYDDIWDDVICAKCHKAVSKYFDASFINDYSVKDNAKFEPYNMKFICRECINSIIKGEM